MRKLLFILSFVSMVCLYFSMQENEGNVVHSTLEIAPLPENRMLVKQWQCEHTYNSDLRSTRVLQEVEDPHPIVLLFQRGSHMRARADFLTMCCVTYDTSGAARLIARMHKKDFVAGLHVVDYYVYRLHRLII